MIAQHDLARRHTGNGFNAFANFFSDAGREFRGAEGAGQVKVYRHLAAFNLYLIQQTEFAERTSDFGVTRRSSRCSNCINIDRHRDTVPVTPVSVAWSAWPAAYARLRWAISSFSKDFNLLSISMPYSRAILPPMIFCLISSVRSTPYSALRSSGSWKAMKSSSSQCGYQIGKSVPQIIRSGPIQKSRLAMISAKWRGSLWTNMFATASEPYTLGQRVAIQQKSSRRGKPT